VSEARDAYVKVVATVLGAALIGGGSWAINMINELKQTQSVVQTELNDLERRVDFLVEKLMDLHPMQRTNLAELRSDDRP